MKVLLTLLEEITYITSRAPIFDIIFTHNQGKLLKYLKVVTFLLFISISSNAHKLDSYFKSTSEQLTLIGESHLDDQSREKLRRSLFQFKLNGGEVLALEMIESNYQYLLDNFEEDFEGSVTELANYLDVRWQYNTKSYMELIEEAKNLGLRLQSIDLDRSKWPEETTIFPVIPDISKVRIAREAHMAKILCEKKELKTIVIIGKFHTLKRFLPAGIKKECALETRSLNLANQVSN